MNTKWCKIFRGCIKTCKWIYLLVSRVDLFEMWRTHVLYFYSYSIICWVYFKGFINFCFEFLFYFKSWDITSIYLIRGNVQGSLMPMLTHNLESFVLSKSPHSLKFHDRIHVFLNESLIPSNHFKIKICYKQYLNEIWKLKVATT